jgi:hypothetical protein
MWKKIRLAAPDYSWPETDRHSPQGKHTSNKRKPERSRLSSERRNAGVGDLRTLFSLAIQNSVKAHQRLGGACRALLGAVPHTIAILAKIGIG